MKKLIAKIKHAFDYIKKTVKKLKDPYWKAKCNYIKYYESLPIQDNVILLESQFAQKLNGNMFYLIKYLTSNDNYKNYKIYVSSWGRYKKKMINTLNFYGIENVNITIYSSDEYVKLLASAKYLFNDVTFPAYYIKKTGQIYTNTWHGTPLKTLGKSIGNEITIGNVQKNFLCSDYLLAPNVYTKEILIRDYMLENISPYSTILCGYPRNEVFFDEDSREKILEEMDLSGKRIYAYMPTWRGGASEIGSDKERVYLKYYLYELDNRLTDDEVLYINLHPLAMHAKDNVALKGLKHIKRFPEKYETYDFLNIADVLITDYSSVFFDFACTRRKIVLFPFDKDEYLEDRGMYFDMDELPFPQVFDIPSLIKELRSGKNYDDDEFTKRFNSFDNINASQQLCDFIILGENTGLTVEKIPNNGKENVLLYSGDLLNNGITTSLRSLLNSLDLSKRNYVFSFSQGKAKKNASMLSTFNSDVNYLALAEYRTLTIKDRFYKFLFNKKFLLADVYMKKNGKRIQQEWFRAYGNAQIDMAIQFNGYDRYIILLYSNFVKNNAIFVHNDMVSEIETRGSQRFDVLKYAYNKYDKVVTVSEDVVPPTVQISKRQDNIITVHNLIDYKTILAKGEMDIELDPKTKCSVETDYFYEVINSDTKKFINIGRYSPEKGHDRLVNAFAGFLSEGKDAYLIIMGGNSRNNGYQDLKNKITEMGLEEKVILLLAVSNPYPILKACDYFIMSSFYEGLPMVLFEADMFKKPIVSTDVKGPHGFLSEYGGTLVEDSEDGVYQGLKMLYDDKVKTLTVDYEEYNKQCLEEFEKIFERKGE